MIEDGKKVTIAFELKDEHGNVWDEATTDSPFSYTHGAKQLMQIVEQGLTGKAIGEHLKIEIPPKDGYGDVDERLKKTLPRAHFEQMPDLKKGMSFSLSEDAHMTFKVTDFNDEHVQVDGNHPLAGKTLSFEITIINVE